MPTLNITDQGRTLIANAKDARWSSWACLIGTALASLVRAVVSSKKAAASAPAVSSLHPSPAEAVVIASLAEHTIEDRLRTLLKLKVRGLITHGEYEMRAQQIVDLI